MRMMMMMMKKMMMTMVMMMMMMMMMYVACSLPKSNPKCWVCAGLPALRMGACALINVLAQVLSSGCNRGLGLDLLPEQKH